jgi:hypothetical protein
MHLGWWFRRIAAATAVVLSLGLAAGDGAALGVELPSVDPALGAETTLPGVSDLPSTSVLPIDPAQPIGPTVPATPITSTPPAPAGPSGPSGSVSPSGSTTSAQAAASRRNGNLQSIGRGRNVVNGDRSPTPGASGADAQRVRSSAAGGRRDSPRSRGQRLSPSSPGFQIFHPSPLENLGRVLAPHASPPRFLGGFSASATGGAGWAPPLLTIMLLIGLGGFLRVAMSTSRHDL